MTEQQKGLFPMAENIVSKLTDYSNSIIQEIERLDDQIEKKRGEIKGLKEKLEDVQLALKEAMKIHLELTPPIDCEVPPAEAPDETEEEHLRTMDAPGPEEPDVSKDAF
jgi:hypothetical protein